MVLLKSDNTNQLLVSFILGVSRLQRVIDMQLVGMPPQLSGPGSCFQFLYEWIDDDASNGISFWT